MSQIVLDLGRIRYRGDPNVRNELNENKNKSVYTNNKYNKL